MATKKNPNFFYNENVEGKMSQALTQPTKKPVGRKGEDADIETDQNWGEEEINIEKSTPGQGPAFFECHDQWKMR